MKKLDLKSIGKSKPNPIFKGLPSHLKDPKCYKDIEKKLRDTLKSDHYHKSVKEYVTCMFCQQKREERQKVMKEMGFKNIGQYLEWRKVMDIITNQRNFQIK